MPDTPDLPPMDLTSNEDVMVLLLALREIGVTDPRVMRAFEQTSRRMFLAGGKAAKTLGPDRAAPISCGQVQTPPTVVARIVKALDLSPEDDVLEIGTGSGYQAAILSRLCLKLFTIERFRTLAGEAESRFQSMRLSNVEIKQGDGLSGWPGHTGFDAIIINAGVEAVSPVMFEQLTPRGVLVAPIVQRGGACDLVAHRRVGTSLDVSQLGRAFFLPIIPGCAEAL